MTTVLCPHGNQVEALDVTMFGDKRPRYIATPCDCPRPCCPFCHDELDQQGRCQGDIECVLFGHLVPEPEIR